MTQEQSGPGTGQEFGAEWASKMGALNERMGIEINATHHRSALAGLVTGVTTPINVGRTLVTSETVVSDEQGRRVCTVRLTCMLRENR